MLKKLLYFAVLILFACNQGDKRSVQEKKPLVKVENKDSIQAILLKIKAGEKAEAIEDFFTDLHRKRGFNGTVLVAQQGQVIYKKAFGLFNREKKDSLEVETVFQLASVSKQFTAVGILMLLEEGKLTLDDSVQKHIQGWPYDGITIRQLLSHRSGLPDYRYFCDQNYCCKKEAISNEQVITLMNEQKPGIYYKPDRHFDYNNTNYMLLATILEKLSGMSYAAFMKEKIFKPLGMTRTFVYDGLDVPKNVAIGYSAGWKRLWNDYQNGVVGDKNIYSTVIDLFKWDKALYENRLLKEETLRLAFLPYSKEMKIRNYGFGWRLKCLPNGDDVAFHGGWWRGYNNLYYRRTKDRSAIIVLSNRVNFCFNNLQPVWDILDGSAYSENTAVEAENL